MEKSEAFAEADIGLLKKYRDYLISDGITLGRVNKYLSDLKKAVELLGKRLPEATEDDIRRIVSVF